MNKEELTRLLERYYNGESTEAEDRFLKEYFSGHEILPGFEAEREIFSYYTAAGEIPEPSADFEARILAGIDAQDSRVRKVSFRKYLLPALSAAASIAVLVSFYFLMVREMEPKDTFKDPKLAYEETRKVLYDVSSKMNHATLALEPVGKIDKMTSKSFKNINKSTVLIEKSLKNLGYLKTSINLREENPVTKN